MTHKGLAVLLPVLLPLFTPAKASAAEKVAVADFDFVDSSGEVKDQTAAHAAWLKELHDVLMAALNHGGRFDAVGITCATPPCSADNLTADTLTDAGKKAGAAVMVFGGIHKISTLITFGRVAVVELASGRSLLDRAITFRGDDEDAWQHADSYISDMVVEALAGARKGK
jgi:hypothetical protein